MLKVREPITHVIDDDAALRESFQVLLELLAGIKVRTYPSAEEFLRNGAPAPHDCLIIDLDMPGISGVDLLDQLRKWHRHSGSIRNRTTGYRGSSLGGRSP